MFWAEDDDDVARLYGMDGEDGDDEYDEDLDEDEDEEDDQQEDGSDEDTYLATARAFAQTFTAAANTARGLRGSLSLPQHPSPPGGSSATDGHNLLAPSSRVAKKQRRSAAARRRAAALSRERAAAAAAEREEDSDPDRCGLMLPEELWDAWERLSDGPKGRQYRMLEVRGWVDVHGSAGARACCRGAVKAVSEVQLLIVIGYPLCDLCSR